MSVTKHITEAYDTWVNILANMDPWQAGIDSTNSRWVFRNATTGFFVHQPNCYWDTGAGSYTYLDSTYNNLTANGNVTLGRYLIHSGDVDTYLDFTDDNIDVVAGSVTFLSVMETTQDILKINPNAADVDFLISASGVTSALFLEGSSGKIGLGIATPDSQLHIWASSAGTVTAPTGTLLTLEKGGEDIASYISILNASQAEGHASAMGLIMGDDLDNDACKVVFNRVAGGTDNLSITLGAVLAMKIEPTAITIPDTMAIGLGSGKAMVTFNDETTDDITVTNARVAIGAVTPDSLLHIYTDDTTGTATSGTLLTLESTSNAYLSILSFSGAVSGFLIGPNSDPDAGRLLYTMDTGQWSLFTLGTEQVRLKTTGLCVVPSSGTIADASAVLDLVSEASYAKCLIEMNQLDQDFAFVDFVGTTAADETKSLSTDAAGAYEGKIRIKINGTDKWLHYFGDHA